MSGLDAEKEAVHLRVTVTGELKKALSILVIVEAYSLRMPSTLDGLIMNECGHHIK